MIQSNDGSVATHSTVVILQQIFYFYSVFKRNSNAPQATLHTFGNTVFWVETKQAEVKPKLETGNAISGQQYVHTEATVTKAGKYCFSMSVYLQVLKEKFESGWP